MKKEIMAYVTALTDVYSGSINQPMVKCLNDILNFAEDIPVEDKERSILAFNTALENSILKSRVLELEESCENMNEIEINLHKRIKALKWNNSALDGNCNVLKEQNIKLVKVNNEFALCNKKQFQMIIELRCKNKALIKTFNY